MYGETGGVFYGEGKVNMDGKYVRIQTRYCGKTGKPVGIFAACWHLMEGVMREDALSEEDKEIYLNIRNWFEENLPNPPYYEDGNTIKAITWFKKDNSKEMLERLQPLIGLLEKYNVDYDVVYSDDVGEIIYEDDFQIAVI